MIKNFKMILILFATAFVNVAFGQTDSELALQKGQEAIKLMDNGKIDESIKLLEEAEKLDPKNFNYPYEMAYAYSLKKEYKKTIKICKKIENHNDANDRVYQLYGSAFDYLGEPKKAIETYEKGLKKYPKSGRLNFELGVMEINAKNYAKALSHFEDGILADPKYPSNYYWASRIFLNSNEKVWGMIYGEIFLNIERNSLRTSEISQLLYETYSKQILYNGDSSIHISFSKDATINFNKADSSRISLPYGIGVYETTIMKSMLGIKNINLNSLDTLRTNFLNQYYENGLDKKYPNVLFEFQKQLQELGHLSAYNHWVLNRGNRVAFVNWVKNNPEKIKNFQNWYNANPLIINETNYFHRIQYNR